MKFYSIRTALLTSLISITALADVTGTVTLKDFDGVDLDTGKTGTILITSGGQSVFELTWMFGILAPKFNLGGNTQVPVSTAIVGAGGAAQFNSLTQSVWLKSAITTPRDSRWVCPRD